MNDRFSRNGRLPKPHQSDAEPGEYVKNEVDIKLDRVSDLWTKLEKKLLKEQPPRRLTCCYFTQYVGEDGDIEEKRYLGLQRHAGKWRICYAIAWDKPADENLPWKPILECDVATRMDATNGIDRLKYEVATTKTEFIPALDEAIDKLEKALLDEIEA